MTSQSRSSAVNRSRPEVIFGAPTWCSPTGRERGEEMTAMGAKKRRTKWLTVTAMLACIAGSAAMADARKADEPGATLYEVTENMYFYDRHGVFISPDKILG